MVIRPNTMFPVPYYSGQGICSTGGISRYLEILKQSVVHRPILGPVNDGRERTVVDEHDAKLPVVINLDPRIIGKFSFGTITKPCRQT
jgi:hypothetical protein